MSEDACIKMPGGIQMKFKGLKREHYTDRWDEAFPIGNGTIGGLVYGNPLHETIATNYESLFLPMPENSDSKPYNGYKYLEETRRLLHEGKFKEATMYYLKGLSEEGAPFNTIVWTNPFETAAEVHIDTCGEHVTSEYVQKLDFATGEASVECLIDGEKYTRKCFVSRSRDILVMNIEKEGAPISLDITLGINPGAHHIEEPSVISEDDNLSLYVTHSEDESGYLATIKAVQNGEGIMVSDGKIHAENVTSLLVLYTLTPWKRNVESYKVKLVRILDMISRTYTSLFKEHEIIHRELFERVSVSFDDSDKEYTNEELRAECTDTCLSPKLLERMADFGRYLEVSSFGKLPPNLQGVWNGNPCPPWSSDYTLNENLQMMMWQIMPGGFNENAISYFDWLEGFVDAFRENAKAYYGCRGIFCAARLSSDGYHRHFCDQWPMVFWISGAGWLSQVYEDYYEYTLDENVLLRGVKFWKEVVLFYEDFLTLDANGKYEFAPSYSPENTPLGSDSPTAINATMDIAIAREVYTNLINACKILDIESDNIEKWENELSMLPDYAVNEDGAVKEWVPAELKDDYHHRHSSHLYMVFPGHEALEDGKEDLLEACHTAARMRLIEGVDAISGWGLAHLANISARLKDSELWYLAMNRLIQVFTLDNLFTGHNEHSLFQMDANLGITASVYEMIAYSAMGKVELLPVLTDFVPNVTVEGLKLRGNAEIEKLCKKSDSFEVTVKNNGFESLRIICPDGFSFENGDTEYVLYGKETVSLTGLKR